MESKPKFVTSDGNSKASHLNSKQVEKRSFIILLNNKKAFVCVDKIFYEGNFAKSRGYFIDDPEVKEEDLSSIIDPILESSFDLQSVMEIAIPSHSIQYIFPLISPTKSSKNNQ